MDYAEEVCRPAIFPALKAAATGPLDTGRGRPSWSAGQRLVFVGRALRGRLQADCPRIIAGTVGTLRIFRDTRQERPIAGHVAPGRSGPR